MKEGRNNNRVREESVISGGRRISDHGFWAGRGEDGQVFPKGAKTRNVPEVEGAGSLPNYEDSEYAVRKAQVEAVRKLKKNSMKGDSRN